MSASRASRHALACVFVTVLIDMIGFGIIIPVVPVLIVELTGQDLSHAALYGGWLLFLYALMQFFCAPVVGNLSDRFGRRPVLLLSLAAFGLDYAVMGFAPSMVWLFVGRFVAGVAGGSYVTANAYIADVSEPGDRAKNFGLVGAAFGVGFVLGPVIGGILGDYGTRVPFFAAAGLAVANLVYGAWVLPETLPVAARRPFSLGRANPVGAIAQMRRYPAVFALFGAVLLYQIAHDANPSVWTYYTMLKFDWTQREVGYSMGCVGAMIVLVQGVLIRVAIPWLGEVRAVVIGYALMAVGFFGYAFSTQGWMMIAFILPWALGEIATPALRGIMANQVADDAQGELAGAITSLRSLTAIGAPLLLTRLFGIFTAEDAPVYFPGAAFLAAGLMILGALAVFGWIAATRPAPAPATR